MLHLEYPDLLFGAPHPIISQFWSNRTRISLLFASQNRCFLNFRRFSFPQLTIPHLNSRFPLPKPKISLFFYANRCIFFISPFQNRWLLHFEHSTSLFYHQSTQFLHFAIIKCIFCNKTDDYSIWHQSDVYFINISLPKAMIS